MRIPDDTIEEVRNSTDIIDVVSAYVRLKKRGKNYLGLCPFHTEKTPSFTVSAEKQMYHCFGCGKGGNLFTFVMEMEKVSFVEAVRSLAAKAGITIPEETRPQTEEQSEAERLYDVCRFAGMQFYKNLVETDEAVPDGRQGKFALDYVHKRGFTDETIRTFGVGYSQNSWDALVQLAATEGFKPEELVKAGVARKREDGSLYDYFRGRVMFPIFSATGRVIGFGARKILEDDPIAGKYINSPETPIYNKSRVLFGLFHAKEAIRQEDMALMVEGYADLISLYQAGIKNVVASSGTALTEEQVALLGRYSKNLTLVYDGDSAGSNATLRGIDIALEQDFNVRIVVLPEEEDPDSFVQKNGGNAFNELLKNAVSFIDFKASRFQQSGAFATPEGKTDAVRSLVQSMAKMNDELKRNFYVKEVAEKYGIHESVLFRELGTLLHERTPFRAGHPPRVEAILPAKEPGVAPEKKSEKIPAEERDLVKLLLEGNLDVLHFILSHISVEQFGNAQTRALAQFLIDRYDERGTIDATSIVHEIADPAMQNLVSDLTLSRYELSRNWEHGIDEPDPMIIARDALWRMQRKAIQRAMEENQRAMRDAAAQHTDTMPLLQRQQELLQMSKQLEQLKTTT
ncbi:MAG TPA: DNA primase [Bacteroidota bacterium]|nr:DNA primase [Bacteroidota bacterium]